MTRVDQDEVELQELVAKGRKGCSVDGCRGRIDPRGDVSMLGKPYSICEDHFEAIFNVLGAQDDDDEWDDDDDEGPPVRPAQWGDVFVEDGGDDQDFDSVLYEVGYRLLEEEGEMDDQS